MNELATTNPFALDSWENMERMAKQVSESGMFGVKTPSQAMCLFAICQAEGLNPITALRRYHLIEGRPSMRADAMLAEFLKAGGGVIWHIRSDSMVCATWFSLHECIDDESRSRGARRFELLWDLETPDIESRKRAEIYSELANLARDGEETILRTHADCHAKGLTVGKNGEVKANWESSPRQMLTARNSTEGIKIVMPSLGAGIPEENELRQVIESEKSSKPANRDAESMQAILDQHLQNAAEAKTDEERKHYQGLASEMRCQIADLTVKTPEKPAQPVQTIETEVIGPEKPEPAKTETPKTAILAPERPLADLDQLPGLEPAPKTPEQPAAPAAPPDWRNYKLAALNITAWKGKLLGSLSKEEINVLWDKRGLPYLKDAKPAFRHEAEMILLAQAFHNPPTE